ncbi:uncharacterized protein LOC120546869 isoform X2 [Perca fluviatilis]|uniref:uncharacterized protein LOC120546869 isoform X2 n=1 Tax=Perca fluviatilis TaxID=8168 RepID=UPI001963CCE5|nr:uncharacterized protein LOC120546869 isoform X2 [Perca fluviatilis]
MAEFRWTKTSLFLILVLQFTVPATGPFISSSIVRVGDEVTLSCQIDSPVCDSTHWIFTDSRRTAAVDLVLDGRIVEKAKVKSDRLSVTANCSLVIKKVTEEDAGHYRCSQFRSRQQALETVVILSVVTMTEHQDSDEVTLNCSVSTYERCKHKVKWLFQGQDVDKLKNQQMKTSQSPCNASVTFPTSHFIYTSRFQLFRCEVTEGDKVKEFPFSPQSSESLTTESSIKSGTNDSSPNLQGGDTITTTTESLTTESSIKDMLVYIIVALVLVALLIIIVAVISWKKTKGNKTRRNDNVGLTSNSATTQFGPETSQDTADPEGGVSYASISYTKKTNGRAQVRSKNDDDAVTYTTVKASSADPSDLYATIN